MKVLVALNHPAHYYLFKFIIQSLKQKNHTVKIVIKQKDVLEELLQLDGVEYQKLVSKRKRKRNAFSVISNSLYELLEQDIAMYKTYKSFKPDVMMGTDIAINHIGKLFKTPSFVYNEDDYEINKLFCKASYPFATAIVAPGYTSVGKYTNKKVAYNGIQKMAYLNPKYFKPQTDILDLAGLKPGETYFIIRLVSLTSGHDIEGKHTGISTEILDNIINILQPHGKVFITSEDQLSDNLKKYQIKIPKNRMHDFMAMSSLFIGDSQTMCAEAGILGTPFIRFNDFVGKIEYLNDLELKYELGWGIETKYPKKLYETIDKIININDIKQTWIEKKAKLFDDKIDLTEFSVWLVENYPESINIIKSDPKYQYRFK